MLKRTRREVAAMIDGYMDADGWWSGTYWQATTVSENLARGIQRVIEAVDRARCALYFNPTKGRTTVEGREVNQRDQWQVRRTTRPQVRADDNGILWCPVRSVTGLDERATVHNIEVARDHSYVAARHVVHNCQDISNAGQRAGIKEGTRSGLWFRFADGIRTLRPGLVLLENVAAIAANGGPAVVGSLADLGYDVAWTTLRASDVGCCHRRDRWFAVAYPVGERGQVPAVGRQPAVEVPVGDGASGRTDVMLPTPRSTRGRSSTETVRTLPTPKATNDENRQTPGQYGPNLGEAIRSENGARWGDYAAAIARWEQTHGPAPDPTDDKGRLSPAFVCWMMGWPDRWTEGPSRSQQLRMLGNGVVPHQAVAAYRFLVGQVTTERMAA